MGNLKLLGIAGDFDADAKSAQAEQVPRLVVRMKAARA